VRDDFQENTFFLVSRLWPKAKHPCFSVQRSLPKFYVNVVVQMSLIIAEKAELISVGLANLLAVGVQVKSNHGSKAGETDKLKALHECHTS